MPSLPPPTPTSTSTSPRSTSWTRWTGSCLTWCAQYCTVLYCTVLYCRFVSHLVCPVFHERTVEAEVEIIQCEHEKNKHSDVWRLNQVLGSRGIFLKSRLGC